MQLVNLFSKDRMSCVCKRAKQSEKVLNIDEQKCHPLPPPTPLRDVVKLVRRNQPN